MSRLALGLPADAACCDCLLQVSDAQAAAEEARAQLPQLREQVALLTAARADLKLQIDELKGKLQVSHEGGAAARAGTCCTRLLTHLSAMQPVCCRPGTLMCPLAERPMGPGGLAVLALC